MSKSKSIEDKIDLLYEGTVKTICPPGHKLVNGECTRMSAKDILTNRRQVKKNAQQSRKSK